MKKPTMGRPPKPPGEALTAKLNFLCLPEERARIERAALKANLKLSAWLRKTTVRASSEGGKA